MVEPDDLAVEQGQFVLVVASLLQRAGLATMAEFGELLSVNAMAVAETSPGGRDPGELGVQRRHRSGSLKRPGA